MGKVFLIHPETPLYAASAGWSGTDEGNRQPKNGEKTMKGTILNRKIFTRDRIRQISMEIQMTGKFPADMTETELSEFRRVQDELHATSRDIVICHLFKYADS